MVNKKAAYECKRCCKNRQKWIYHSVSNPWSVLITQVFTAWVKHIVFRCCVRVCLACTQRKAPKTSTSGMPPAVRGLQGWMCVYRRALAGGGRDLVQNNGTTVECGAAGNILNQTRKSCGLSGGTMYQDFHQFDVLFNPMTPRTIFLCGWLPAIVFHTTKLEDHVPWNISQTCESFTENLHPNVWASIVPMLKSHWIWSVSVSLQAVH